MKQYDLIILSSLVLLTKSADFPESASPCWSFDGDTIEGGDSTTASFEVLTQTVETDFLHDITILFAYDATFPDLSCS